MKYIQKEDTQMHTKKQKVKRARDNYMGEENGKKTFDNLFVNLILILLYYIIISIIYITIYFIIFFYYH
jgi:hypothetical protein